MLISDWLLNFKINLVALLIGCQRVNSVTLGRPNLILVNELEMLTKMLLSRPLRDVDNVVATLSLNVDSSGIYEILLSK